MALTRTYFEFFREHARWHPGGVTCVVDVGRVSAVTPVLVEGVAVTLRVAVPRMDRRLDVETLTSSNLFPWISNLNPAYCTGRLS